MQSVVQMVVVLTLVSLAPAIVLTATVFTRFVVVFSFLRMGLGAQGAPPSQVLVGLALCMTFFVMSPTATAVHEQAVKPYMAGQMNEEAALTAATPVMREFLLKRTRSDDLELFYGVSGLARPAGPQDVPLRIAVPAFALSELRTAFKMGFVVLLPFLVVDLAIATILASLGMEPVFISQPAFVGQNIQLDVGGGLRMVIDQELDSLVGPHVDEALDFFGSAAETGPEK